METWKVTVQGIDVTNSVEFVKFNDKFNYVGIGSPDIFGFIPTIRKYDIEVKFEDDAGEKTVTVFESKGRYVAIEFDGSEVLMFTQVK